MVVTIQPVITYQPDRQTKARWAVQYAYEPGNVLVQVMPEKARALKPTRNSLEPRRNPFPKPGALQGRLYSGGMRQASFQGLGSRLVADRSGWNRLAFMTERDRDTQQTSPSSEHKVYAIWSEQDRAKPEGRPMVRKGWYTKDGAGWTSFDTRYG